MLRINVVLKRLTRKPIQDTVPLREILDTRVQLYRGSTNWEQWLIVQRPIWSAREK